MPLDRRDQNEEPGADGADEARPVRVPERPLFRVRRERAGEFDSTSLWAAFSEQAAVDAAAADAQPGDLYAVRDATSPAGSPEACYVHLGTFQNSRPHFMRVSAAEGRAAAFMARPTLQGLRGLARQASADRDPARRGPPPAGMWAALSAVAADVRPVDAAEMAALASAVLRWYDGGVAAGKPGG